MQNIKKRSALRVLLLLGMALLLPCFLFTVGNVLLSSWPLYGRSRLALCLLTPFCLLLILLLFRLSGPLARLLQGHERAALIGFAALYFVLQTALGLCLRHVPITDAEQCVTAAELLCDTGTFSTSERACIYFSRYPFNLGYVYLLSFLFRFCGIFGLTDRYAQMVVAAALLFSAGLAASAKLARRLAGPAGEARLLLLFALCLPFYTCAAECYTDVFALAFPPLILLAYAKAAEAENRKQRVLHAVLFGLLTFLGMQLRMTAAIASLACGLQALFEKRFRALLCCLAAVMLFCIPGNALVNAENERHLGAEQLEKNRLPIWHWVAMGLPVQEDQGYGQYGDGGWLLFSTSFEDPSARSAALLSEIRDRVYYLRYPDRFLNLLSRKNLASFGDGTFGLQAAVEADEKTPDNPVKQFFFTEGRLHTAYQHLCTALLMSGILLCCLALLQALRREDTRPSALFITLLGVFLYLCMWETLARYFFMFQMVLLIGGARFSPEAPRAA